MPWIIKGALIQQAQEKAPGWKDSKGLASTIANAIPTGEIKKILDKKPTAPVDWATTIPLTLPDSNRENLHVVVCVSQEAIEIYPNYEKPTSAKKKFGTA